MLKLQELDKQYKPEVVNEFLGDVKFKFHKDYNGAVTLFEEAYLHSNNEIYLIKIGRCFEKQKDNEMAMKFYQKSIQFNRKYVMGLLHIGWLLSRIGDFEAGIEYLRAAYELAPENPDAITKFCLILIYFPSTVSDAYKILKRALALEPEVPQLIVAYAKSLSKLNPPQEEKAIEILEDANLTVKDFSENIKAQYLLAVLYEQRNSLNKAIQLYKNILTLKKHHVPSLVRLGNIFANMKEYNRSLKYLMFALKLEENALANFGVGKVLQYTGDQAGALKYYNTCIEQNPRFHK